MNIACPAIEAARKGVLKQSKRAWDAYERLKANWLAAHPKATPGEVAAACREIADQLGL